METTNRQSEYPISDLILHRWSPRSMTGDSISHNDLMTIFEAAKWAPSSYNNQPWRFIYATRESSYWDTFYSLLVDFNQRWTKNAAVLVVIISKTTFNNNQPSLTHSFDTGAAWQNLALQAHLLGFVAHGMEGFDYEKAKKMLHIPEEYQVEAMIAIGKKAPKENLPQDLQQKEIPSLRRSLEKTVFEGKFT